MGGVGELKERGEWGSCGKGRGWGGKKLGVLYQKRKIQGVGEERSEEKIAREKCLDIYNTKNRSAPAPEEMCTCSLAGFSGRFGS